MSKPLAIFAPHIGALSETFIRRHMGDLAPGKTVVVALTDREPLAGHWTVDCPKLVIDRIQEQPAKLGMLERLGLRSPRQQTDNIEVVRSFLVKHRVKVILAEYLDHALPWLSLAQELGIRFFPYALGYDVSQRVREQKWRDEYLRYQDAAGIIAVSHRAKDRLGALGLEPAKLHVVPCGAVVPDRPLTRDNSARIHCLAVGRMVAKKAPLLTIQAFQRALQINPNLHLDYIGDGDLFSEAHQFIVDSDLQEHVILHGSQTSDVVQRYLKEADIFLQHSITDPETGDEEGLPVVILEAMAQSLSVVSTMHSAIPEAVLTGDTGYLVEEGDTVGMSQRILELAGDNDLRNRMGRRGWSRVRDKFSWDQGKIELRRILGLSNQT